MIATHHAARNILATLGMKCAASYLRRRNVPLETAIAWLLGVRAYHQHIDREVK